MGINKSVVVATAAAAAVIGLAAAGTSLWRAGRQLDRIAPAGEDASAARADTRPRRASEARATDAVAARGPSRPRPAPPRGAASGLEHASRLGPRVTTPERPAAALPPTDAAPVPAAQDAELRAALDELLADPDPEVRRDATEFIELYLGE